MDECYLGRIVAVGRTPRGNMAAMYRVSSRSFPNRKAVVSNEKQTVAIVPKEGHETDIYRNPYIAYNCARILGDIALVSNGSQTDPIAEKIVSGMSLRDSLIYSLAAMDYEKDDYNTPRIAGIVTKEEGWLGIIRHDGIDVRRFELRPGSCFYVATYEHTVPCAHYTGTMETEGAASACDLVLGKGVFASFTNPVTAVGVVQTDNGYEMVAKDAGK